MPARWAIVPFELIESYIPKTGLIIDIGCGEGVMATLLAISSPKRKVIGMDIDNSKIKLGQSVAQKIVNLSFKSQDILRKNLPNASAFVLSDFLHHIPSTKHFWILKKLTKSLSKGGVIVVKEIDMKDGIRSKFSHFFDFIFYPTEKVNFIRSNDLFDSLTQLGLKVKIVKVKKWFPGSTTLFICQK